jgi:type I restriction enzyme S subunit
VRLDVAKSIDPTRFPEQNFELYSVPSFDSRVPEVVPGREVGSNKQIVETGTVLLCKINPRINRAWVVGDNSDHLKIASTEWIPFPKRPEIEPAFLAYYLSCEHVRVFLASNASGVGGSLMRVSHRTLADYPFPLAPLAEQCRIVAAVEQQFTRLDEGVASLRRVQTALRRYRAAVLKAAVEGKLTEAWRTQHLGVEPASELLSCISAERRARWAADQRARGKDPAKARYEEPSSPDTTNLSELPTGWCWATVDQLASYEPRSLQSGPFGSALHHSEFQDTGILAIGIDNVLEGQFSLGREHRISQEKYKELVRFTARPLDVLVTVMATVGRCCVVPPDLETAIITKHVYRISLDQRTGNPYFVMHALQGGPDVRKQLFGQVQGQTRPGINGEILRKIALPIPPISEQEQIVAEVERCLSDVSALEATVEANLKRAELLRQSILKRAFSGQLVPQDLDDEPASVLLARLRQERAGRNGASGALTERAVTAPMAAASKVSQAIQKDELWRA